MFSPGGAMAVYNIKLLCYHSFSFS